MRQLIKDFVKICSDNLELKEPIYEFGSFRVRGQEELADLRPLFPKKEYVGADMRNGLGVDVILDLHNIDLPDKSVGTVILIDTLEHVEYPYKALAEIHRILKPDGIVIMSSVMNFPIHDYPYDYWRFTPAAFKSLLSEFNSWFVDYIGDEKFPHTILGIGFKSRRNETNFSKFFVQWYNYKILLKKTKYNLKIVLEMLIPPVIFKLLKQIVYGLQRTKGMIKA